MFDIEKHEIKRCSINEFNNILLSLKSKKLINESAQGKNIGPRVYIWTNISKCFLVYNDFGYRTTTKCFETDLNDLYEDGYLENIESVSRASSICGKSLKFPRVVKDKSEATVNAWGINWVNHKYNQKNTYCYEYDMHLAWLSTFMTCYLPDTSKEPRLNDIVKEGEIGFLKKGYCNSNWNCGDCVVFDGYADYIFPIMKCPNLEWCKKLLNNINNSKGLKRKNLKNRFNEWLGTLQNKNPYIRVAVIAQSNKKIIDLIRKYGKKLLFSVTDSLGSIERIPELDNMINNEAGGWSIKNEGYLYLDNNNRLYLDENGYIVNSNIKGVPKEHIKNLHINEYKNLVKKRDSSKNLYKLNLNKRRLEKNE